MASNQPTHSSNTTANSGKRPHSPDFPGEEGATNSSFELDHSCKRYKCQVTFVLDSESPQPTDEDSESRHSIQQASTVSAKDTCDTSWSLDESTDVELEYDVASSHSAEKLWSNCDSSGSQEILYSNPKNSVPIAAHLNEDRDMWADSSSSNSNSINNDAPQTENWKCVRCKSKCTPFTRFCNKCFQLRKSYFPERPKRTHLRRRKRAASPRATPPRAASPQPGPSFAAPPKGPDLEQPQSSRKQAANEQPDGKLKKADSGVNLASETASTSQSYSQMLEDAVPPQDVDRELLSPKSELCFMCVDRPKDGGFIHKACVHVLCCYQCALKVWNKTTRCPMCNSRPSTVLKLIFG